MKKSISNLRPIKEAIIIVLIYGILGIIWVSFTDRILSSLIRDYNKYQYAQTLKGWFYIFITMFFLFLLVYRRLTQYKGTLITLNYSFKTLSKLENQLKTNIKKLEEKQTELSISNQRYELAVDGVNDAIWDWDILNNIYYLSPKWKNKIMGPCDDETYINWLNYIHPEDQERYIDFIDSFIKKEREIYHYIFRIVCYNESILWIYSNGKTIYNDNRKAIRMAGSHTDITNQIKLKEEYKKNNFLVEKIVNNASSFIVIWDQNGNVKQINSYVTKILGYENKDIVNKNWYNHFAPNLSTDERDNFLFHINQGQINHYNSHIKSMNNKDVYILWTSNILYQYKEDEYDIISMGTDITSLKIIKDELNYLSFYDELTDLPNRNFFEKHVKGLIENEQSFALLYLDIDNFKHVNETLGHNAGDQFLKDIGKTLTNYFKAPHFVSRLSSDQFLIIVYNDNKIEQIIKHLNYISKENSKPWVFKKQEYFITVTVGISLYPEHGKDVQTLLKNADIALHSAKESGKNSFHVFDRKMLDANALFIKTINELKKAINNNELVLRYQPLVNLDINKVIGVEVLVRWDHPNRGLLSPIEFIGIAEKIGFIDLIDQDVFEKACKQKSQWDKLGYQDLKVSVNLSNKRFKNQMLYEEIYKVIKKYDIDPKTIQLEITESVVMENLDQGVEILEKLRALGISIALDDFGKGFSSLNYLMTLPIDNVKLDQVFIQNIHLDKNKLIIQSIIQLSHALNKQVTVEGIETLEQLNLIKQYKGEIGQGYYFEKPVDSDTILEIFKKA